MEQTEYPQNLYQLNSQLKKQIQQSTKNLHLAIQQCLDKSEPQILLPFPQKSISKKFQNLKALQNLLKNQLSQIALETTLYNESLLKISERLIQKQLIRQQSNQMALIIKKYEEQLLPLRSQSVQKQNQYYYAYKTIYQSYEDSYYNCVPNVERLSSLMRNYDIKQKIKSCCLELIREKEQYQEIKSIMEDNKNQLNENKEIIQQDQLQDQEMVIEENCSQDKENWYGFPKNKGKEQFRKSRQPKSMKVPFGTLENLDNQIQKYKKTLMKFNCLDHQQTTTVSFKKALKLQKQQNTQQQNQNVPNLDKINRQKLGIPNFSHMSSYDYHLIKTYFSKIQRQQQKHQKLAEQYKNYKQVYDMLNQESKKLKKQLYERNNLREKQVLQNDLDEQIQRKIEKQKFFEREQQVLEKDIQLQNEVKQFQFAPDKFKQEQIVRSSKILATDYFQSSPDRFRSPILLCRKVQIHQDYKKPEGSNSLNQQFCESNSENQQRVVAISYNDEGSQFF